MKEFIIYQAEVAICLALFYGFFHVFLKNEVQFQTRRFYFLFSFLVAFLIPVLEITWTFEKELPTLPIEYIYSFTPYLATPVQEVTSWSVWDILSLVWLTGFVIMIFRLAISLIKIRHILNHTNKLEGNIRTIDSEVQSFSFFHWIVINQRHYESQAKQYILDHELAHSRQYHSIDIMLMEMAKCLQWFNPFAWILGSRMILNLEFLADQTVLNSHQNLKEYQVSLLQLASFASYKPLKIEFSKLHLKQRFKMMGRTASKIHPIKGLGLLILILIMGITFSVKGNQQKITQQVTKSINRLVEETPSEKLPVDKDATITVNGKVLGGGKPISGASIIAKALNLGTITDKDGDFTLGVPNNTKLTITYPGYVISHFTVNPATKPMSPVVISVEEITPEKNGQYNPIYVIDGEVFNHEQGKTKLDQMNPESIFSISVNSGKPDLVKKYGEKANDGVLFVTLKESLSIDKESKTSVPKSE